MQRMYNYENAIVIRTVMLSSVGRGQYLYGAIIV
jgi:hypothetical protein